MSLSVRSVALIAVGLGVVAGLVLPRSREADDDEPDGPTEPLGPAPADAARHVEGRRVLEQGFQLALGRQGTLAELQYVQSVGGFAESSYGRGWKGAMANCFNWGAVQCNANNRNQPGGCAPYEDSHSSGEKYSQEFRCYTSNAEGAADLVRKVIKDRPRTAAALAAHRSIFDASFAMRRERYYGGFCPKATTAHGKETANASFGKPDRDGGTLACQQEAVTGHAERIHHGMRVIAASLAERLAMPLGDYDSARERYMKEANA